MDTGDKNAKYREMMARLGRELAERKATQEPSKEAKPNSLVGRGLGQYILDILEGRVTEKQVRKIFIERFLVDEKSEWEQLIDECKRSFWKDNSEKVEAIARRFKSFKKPGKIVESDRDLAGSFVNNWVDMGDNVDVGVTKEEKPVW